MKRRVELVLWCSFLSVLAVSCTRQETTRTWPPAASPKILAIGNLTWQDVDALDRDETLFLITVGMLEEHGPARRTAVT